MLDKIDSSEHDDDDSITLEQVAVFHPKKAVFPNDNIKKIDLAEYYDSVSSLMLIHLKDRCLAMERYPDGFGKSGGFVSGPVDHLPDYVVTAPPIDEKNDKQRILCQNAKTLIYLTDRDNITYHGSLSRYDKPAFPDKMIFNLDPPDVTYFEEVAESAFLLKGLLEEANMYPYVMTTGSRGLHVVCPLRRNRGFDQVMAFLQDIAFKAIERRPELVTADQNSQKQGERILIDLSRNVANGTTIIPYSVRAMEHAPIATPLSWGD